MWSTKSWKSGKKRWTVCTRVAAVFDWAEAVKPSCWGAGPVICWSQAHALLPAAHWIWSQLPLSWLHFVFDQLVCLLSVVIFKHLMFMIIYNVYFQFVCDTSLSVCTCLVLPFVNILLIIKTFVVITFYIIIIYIVIIIIKRNER